MTSLKATNNRVAWQYVSDDGNTYRISAKAAYVLDATDGAKYGGGAGTSSNARIPKDMKPRRQSFSAAGHPDKWVIAYDKTSDVWTDADCGLTLDDNGTDVAYISNGVEGHRNEKRRRNISPAQTS